MKQTAYMLVCKNIQCSFLYKKVQYKSLVIRQHNATLNEWRTGENVMHSTTALPATYYHHVSNLNLGINPIRMLTVNVDVFGKNNDKDSNHYKCRWHNC